MIKYKEIEEEPMMVAEDFSWGGQWTEDKLDAFENYVKAYLTIMNSYRDKYSWKLLYFDGFAGSGSRTKNKDNNRAEENLFEECNIFEEEIDTYKGAAERVLNIEQRGFDSYFFIDKDKDSSNKLKQKLSRYEDSKSLNFITSDANGELHKLADKMRKDNSIASLVLLDPFGMQVDWVSIENLKDTRTDLWILIPTGVIVLFLRASKTTELSNNSSTIYALIQGFLLPSLSIYSPKEHSTTLNPSFLGNLIVTFFPATILAQSSSVKSNSVLFVVLL